MKKTQFNDRRSKKDRRDWDMFVYPDRRTHAKRRKNRDRRAGNGSYQGMERREICMHEEPEAEEEISKDRQSYIPYKDSYTTAEVAKLLHLSQNTLLIWIKNGLIDEGSISRSPDGKRMWTRENIKTVERIKQFEGWE